MLTRSEVEEGGYDLRKFVIDFDADFRKQSNQPDAEVCIEPTAID